MRIARLELNHFRNYTQLILDPGSGLNVFVGRNAQGKSNLLEALYILATGKSVRVAKDVELVHFGETKATIRAEVERTCAGNIQLDWDFPLTEKKSARINSVRYTRLGEVIGQVNAVLFDSSDLDIVRGEPAIRRRFLDLEIGQTSPRYVQALSLFRKALEQRNKLLRDLRDGRAGQDAHDVLPTWNILLVQHGALLMERRQRFITRLAELAADVHQTLSDGRDRLDITYSPSFELGHATDASMLQERFIDALEKVEREELQRGTTLRGPQRDDIIFLVDGRDCRLYGSQGQQRTVALSLKLAERQLIDEMVGEPPLLLLDDVLSDLDDVRRRHLFDLTAQSGSQTFLSCTNLRAFSKDVLDRACLYNVSGGKVTRQ